MIPCRKYFIAICACLSLVFSLIQVHPSFADAVEENFQDMPSNTDLGSITITYNDKNKTILVVGNGLLNKEGWTSFYRKKGLFAYESRDLVRTEFRGNIIFPEDSSELFRKLKGELILPDTIDTSRVKNMAAMFADAKEADPNVRHWDVSNVTDMASMFAGAENANPDVSQWDVHNVIGMSSMFKNAYSADPDVSDWNVSNVKNMYAMFYGARSANPDVSKWDVSNVTNMSLMFSYARKANPDISSWKFNSSVKKDGYLRGSASTPNTQEDNSAIVDNIIKSIPFLLLVLGILGLGSILTNEALIHTIIPQNILQPAQIRQ